MPFHAVQKYMLSDLQACRGKDGRSKTDLMYMQQCPLPLCMSDSINWSVFVFVCVHECSRCNNQLDGVIEQNIIKPPQSLKTVSIITKYNCYQLKSL